VQVHKNGQEKRKEILFIQEWKKTFWLQNSNVRWERGTTTTTIKQQAK